jgi:GNAT superfamily N-acetyltransferase
MKGKMTVETSTNAQATVRLADPEDAEQAARLCHQLGYPVSTREARTRIQQILGEAGHVLYVAELTDGRLAGWVHAHVHPLVVADLCAEIGGIVVDESHRGCGIGRLLMQHVEAWARSHGCGAVYLRSNIVREDAHIFYKKIGYDNIKTSLTFRKLL